MFLFAYGSLIWKPDFPHRSVTPGCVYGFVRRFWQRDPVHRGDDENPGLVVTLIDQDLYERSIPSKNFDGSSRRASPLCVDADNRNLDRIEESSTLEWCWGAVIDIDPACEQSVLEHLLHRERAGYSMRNITVYPEENKDVQPLVENCIVFVGEESNPYFTGYLDSDSTASIIAKSAGSSGLNSEYLYRLCDAMRRFGSHTHDDYLSDLEARVRKLDKLDPKSISISPPKQLHASPEVCSESRIVEDFEEDIPGYCYAS